MAGPNNYAAFVPSTGAYPLAIRETPVPEPKAGYIVLKTATFAINPVDHVMQDTGLFINAGSYPFVLGCDVAGTVYASASDQFKVGDRVIGHANGIASQDPAEGGFQHYVKVSAQLTAKIPGDMAFVDAVVLPLSITTAASGLYSKDFLKLPYPTLDPKPTGQTLVVWGGSSSVGSTTIQLAAASGTRVLATASAKNAAYCKRLGAAAVFEYAQADISEQLAQALDYSDKDFVGVYDAIDQPSSQKAIYEVLQKIGGGFVACVMQEKSDLPKGVESKVVYAPFQGPAEKDVSQAVWGTYLPQALQQGKFKPAPPALMVGKGLEKVQEAIDILKRGVSCQKVVVEL